MKKYMIFKSLNMIVAAAFLAACSAAIEPPNGMIEWSLANTTGSKVTMSVYDKVCNRNYFRVAVPRAREKPISTCADTNGKADVRYRRYSYKMSEDNPWIDTTVAANQALMIR